jgi:capsular polysaccharide biosynthesis protein
MLRLHPSMLSSPPAKLFEEARVPERIVLPHHRVRNRAPATEILAVRGYELGAHGLLQQEGRVWVNDAVQPAYVNNCMQPDALNLPEIWRGALLDPSAEIIEVDVPVGVVLHPNLVYGHFLLEMLPRLLLLAHLRTLGHAFAVAVPSDAPEWTRAFVALLFGPDETLSYHSKRQRVRAPCFILPSMMNADYHFHPQMNALLENLLARVVGPMLPVPRPPRRIYLSRRTFGGWHGLRNEDEVERMLEAMGFATVHPQDLPFPEQLALYAGADCIVADFGSALHNSLFAPLGCGVVAINWLNRCQSGIAALRAQPLAYLPPLQGFHDATQPRESDALHTSIDAADLARQVEAFLRFAAG